MKVNAKYFGMIAEKIGKSEDRFEMKIEEATDLRQYFENKYPAIVNMNYNFAINQEMTDEIPSGVKNIEIALLPPFAGG